MIKWTSEVFPTPTNSLKFQGAISQKSKRGFTIEIE